MHESLLRAHRLQPILFDMAPMHLQLYRSQGIAVICTGKPYECCSRTIVIIEFCVRSASSCIRHASSMWPQWSVLLTEQEVVCVRG